MSQSRPSPGIDQYFSHESPCHHQQQPGNPGYDGVAAGLVDLDAGFGPPSRTHSSNLRSSRKEACLDLHSLPSLICDDMLLMAAVGGQSPSSSHSPGDKPMTKQGGDVARPHYATEKRYRHRLNDKFKALQACLTEPDHRLCPQLAREKAKFLAALQAGRNGEQKKSCVLAMTLEYVETLETRSKQTNAEIERCRQLLLKYTMQLARILLDENAPHPQ